MSPDQLDEQAERRGSTRNAPLAVTPRASVAAPGTPIKSRRRWVTLVVLCVSLLIVNLDSTILNVALPTIVRDLHASSSELQWIVDAYAIVFAGLLLVFGNASDRVGRKKVFAAGLVLFALGSAAAAFSSSPDRLIAARALIAEGLPGEQIYGTVPDAGLPKGFVYAAARTS